MGDAAAQDRVQIRLHEDGVAEVLLARSDKLNAMDLAMFEGLHAAAARASEEITAGRARAVLVAGEGRAFSAGLDVSLFGAQVEEGVPDDQIAWMQGAFSAFEDLAVPTVAAVQGVAIGAGFQLALACHLRVAARDATMGLLETRWGLLPDLGGTYRLPRLVGLGRATDLAVTARTVDAETALVWGLVDQLLDGESFPVEARRYAARLAAGPTAATGQIPALMRLSTVRSREDQLAAERGAQARCLASDDFREAVNAALERRDPRFRGNLPAARPARRLFAGPGNTAGA